MRVTIFGATGLLGKHLVRQWVEDEVTGLGSRDADLRNADQIKEAVQRTRPEWIVLAAAYTDVDGCETNPELAMTVNTSGALRVAQAAKAQGSRLLFLSTDYVFDGAKKTPYETDDARAPLNVYGRSKTNAESAIVKILPDACIVRTSWLFGVGGRCFPDTILKLAAERSVIDVVDDQRGSPTYVADLSGAIIELCRANAAGIVHATNRGNCTWFEFAREMLAASDVSTQVRSTTSDQIVRPATRPKYSVLSSISLEQRGITLPTWRDAVVRYTQARKSAERG